MFKHLPSFLLSTVVAFCVQALPASKTSIVSDSQACHLYGAGCNSSNTGPLYPYCSGCGMTNPIKSGSMGAQTVMFENCENSTGSSCTYPYWVPCAF